MIKRTIKIGRWSVDFLLATDKYDEEGVLSDMYDIDAPYSVMLRAANVMKRNDINCGFTYGNEELRRAVVVVGPTSSGKEFLNTLIHEVHHLAVLIADSLGVDLESETPAYIAGDYAMELAEIVCAFGCPHCRFD